MNEAFKGARGLLRGFVSESDGTPSSSRLSMIWRCLVDSAVVSVLVLGIWKLPIDKATLIVNALPVILAALAMWTVTPYGTNKGAGALSDAAQTLQSYFVNKKQP